MRSQRGQSLDDIYSEVWKILSIGMSRPSEISKDLALPHVSSQRRRTNGCLSECLLPQTRACCSASPVPGEAEAEEHDHNWVALASDRSKFDSWLSHFVGVWLSCLTPLSTNFLSYKTEIILTPQSLWKSTWDEVWIWLHCLVFAQHIGNTWMHKENEREEEALIEGF